MVTMRDEYSTGAIPQGIALFYFVELVEEIKCDEEEKKTIDCYYHCYDNNLRFYVHRL